MSVLEGSSRLAAFGRIEDQLKSAVAAHRRFVDETLRQSPISSSGVSFEKYQEVVTELEDERIAHARAKAELSETQDRLELALGEVEILQKQLQREKAQFERTFLLINSKVAKNNTEAVHMAESDRSVDGCISGSCDSESMFANRSLSGSTGSREFTSSEMEKFGMRPSKSTLSSLSSEAEFKCDEVVWDNFSTVVASGVTLVSQMQKDSRVNLKSSSNDSLKSFASSKTSRSSVASSHSVVKGKTFAKPGQKLQNSFKTKNLTKTVLSSKN